MIPGLPITPVSTDGLTKLSAGQPDAFSKSLKSNEFNGFSLDDIGVPGLPELEAVPFLLALDSKQTQLLQGLKLPPELAAKLQDLLSNPQLASHLKLEPQQLQLLQKQLSTSGQFALNHQLPDSSLELLKQGFANISDHELASSVSKTNRDFLNFVSQEFSNLFDAQAKRPLFDVSANQFSNRILLANNSPLDSMIKIEGTGITQSASVITQSPSASSQSILTYQPTVNVDTLLAKPQWQEAFNSKVMLLAQDQRQIAHIHIKPPELGPVEIRMSIASEQTHIQFISQHGVVREAIEDAFPRLREMMSDSGINLGDVNVSDHAGTSYQDANELNTPELVSSQSEEAEQQPQSSSGQILLERAGLIDQYV